MMVTILHTKRALPIKLITDVAYVIQQCRRRPGLSTGLRLSHREETQDNIDFVPVRDLDRSDGERLDEADVEESPSREWQTRPNSPTSTYTLLIEKDTFQHSLRRYKH
jgi:hypothetical protein